MSAGRRGAAALAALLALAATLQALVWVRAWVLYARLPERIPIHFDAAGEPDRWTTRSPAAWFGLCVIPLALAVLLGAIAWWLPSLARGAPALVNVPRKDVFMRLSPAGRMCVVRPVRLHLLWTTAVVEAMFIAIQEGTARVATGAWSAMPVWPVLAVVGAIIGPIPWMYVRVRAEIEREAMAEGVAEAGRRR